jgi:hypothetical protein
VIVKQSSKRLLEAALFTSLSLLPVPARACSLAACIGGGSEARRDFVILVKHEGKPLRGVKIEIKSNAPNVDSTTYTGVTGFDGKAAITNLSPGEYWLSASLLGISAVYQCFHVAQQPSRRAKRAMVYIWGDLAPAMQRVAGRLIDSQPGTGETPLWNIIHRQVVPIAGARLRLQNAISGEVFEATSDDHGEFRFDPVPTGTYVLHIEGGATGRSYDPTDLLMKVRATATKNAVVLTRQEPSGTNCGDASLVPSWK